MPEPRSQPGSLIRYGDKRASQRVRDYTPPWHLWKPGPKLSTRAARWIERYLSVPTGHGAGGPLKMHPYQRRILRETYDNNNSMLVVSIPAANAKTTTLAAMALERMARGDSYAEVAVFATKQEQAQWLVDVAKQMVEANPDLVDLFVYRVHQAILEYVPTGSHMRAHPARVHYAQGLNFSLAIVDEIGFCDDAVVQALIARISKRPDSIVVGIGTPGFEPNIMHKLRGFYVDGTLPPGVAYMEYAAAAGCEITDEKQWAKANPGMAAGIVTREALATQAAILPERDFRVYHLGQWVEQAIVQWLPPGAWLACPVAPVPEEGAEVVIAVDGTYKRTTAVVGATVGLGEVFHVWAAEQASDDELTDVLAQANERWKVRLLCPFGRVRTELFRDMANLGMVVEPWHERHVESVTATNEFYRAIVERRVPHDHHPLVTEHMNNVASRSTPDGIVLQRAAPEGRWIDAAMAARTAWWKAQQLNPVGDLRIY